MNFDIVNAVHQELTLSYTQAGRVVPSTIDVVAASMADALGFSDVDEVHSVFRRARDLSDVPTQRTLKDALFAHREASVQKPVAIAYREWLTRNQYDYINAWWHLHGTRMPWLDDEKAKGIVTAFEADPKNSEFVNYQRSWTHVAADNVSRYGVTEMRARI